MLENMHPYKTLVYLGMFGSGLIFLFMAAAFIASQPDEEIYSQYNIPRSFVLSSIVLLISTYTASKILPSYVKDDTRKLKNFLLSTFLLGLCFTGLQFFGWMELSKMGIDFRGLPSGSFLYVLSGIHIFHLVGAMGFALMLIIHVQKCSNDHVKKLILLSNPYDRMRFQLFSTYWKFMDFVWLFLFLLFIWMF
ncbi:cytochrome c oxidase subunit 3 [Negadavirga shengliensis]|uniref:Heme-copper oxidase subunit III n=1 Tax=Negadavirga shengliensis TaxID=1389218 RepID=A0ABV9T191_9BACT